MLLDVHLLLLLLWWRRGQTCVHFWVYFKVRVKIVSGAVDLLYPLFFSTLQPTDSQHCTCSGSNERPMAFNAGVDKPAKKACVCVCVMFECTTVGFGRIWAKLRMSTRSRSKESRPMRWRLPGGFERQCIATTYNGIT